MNNRDDRFGRGGRFGDMDDREMGGRWEREREMQGRGEIDWDRARFDDDRFGGASRGRQLSGSYGVREDRDRMGMSGMPDRGDRGHSGSWDASYGANRRFASGIGGGQYEGRDWRDNNTVRDFGGGFGGYGNQAGGYQAGRFGREGSYEFGGDERSAYDRREQRDYGRREPYGERQRDFGGPGGGYGSGAGPTGWDNASPSGEYSGGGYSGTGYGAGRYGMRGERWGEERYGMGSMDRERGHDGRGGMMERIGHWFERKLHMRGPNRGPKNYRRSDDRIREDVCDRLMTVDWLDTSDVDITVASGEITLSGTVPDRFMKRYIEEIAESVLGVTEVQNSLRVRRAEEQTLAPQGGQMTGQSGAQSGTATQSTTGGNGSTGSTPTRPGDKSHRA